MNEPFDATGKGPTQPQPAQPEYIASNVPAAYAPPATGYRSSGTLAVWTVGLLGLVAILCLGELISNLMKADVFTQIGAGVKFPHAQLVADDLRHRIIVFVRLTAYLTCGLTYCFWFYRVCRNAVSLGALLKFTPGRAVGNWFIPIVSLWQPYQTVRELWDFNFFASPSAREAALAPLLLRVWWACWLGTLVTSRVVSARTKSAKKVPELLTVVHWSMAYDVLVFLAALLALWTVVRITRGQEAMYREQSEGANAA